MIGKAPSLTTAGQDLFIRAASGEAIVFTRFKIGNGTLPSGSSGKDLTDLINPVVSFSITSVDASNAGFLKINGHFDSTDVESDFKLRELGVFCKGEDDIEKLYCYANDGDNAGIMKANESDVSAEHDITVIVAIGEAEHVSAIISAGTLYASKASFDAHVANVSNPHEVTKAQVGLGNVPNVTTNNQTPTYTVAGTLAALASGEKMSTSFGKISKAVSSLISHLSNKSNPHNVTLTQLNAAAKSHTHSTSDISSGTLPVSRGGTGKSSAAEAGTSLLENVLNKAKNTKFVYYGDWNDLRTPGIYFMFANSGAHDPNPESSQDTYLVLVFEPTAGYTNQIALSAGTIPKIYIRWYITGTGNWGNWYSD